jgi:quinoprotein glucose dehydrogenase
MRCLMLLALAAATAAAQRYSPLKSISTKNVGQLTVAWTHRTGALEPESNLNRKAAFESTPLLVDGLLYVTTPFNHVIALDPATGARKWKYDPKIDRSRNYSEVTNRGVAAWIDPKAAANMPCRLVLFEGTIDARLLAIDGKSGKLCYEVDLTGGVDHRHAGDYQVTSAPTIVGDFVITGSSIGDNGHVDMERGLVRAFDARTGRLRWSWDPIPWANTQKPRTGAANAWSTFAADVKRDLVFIPTGSASPDYYGGLRPGDNRHANSVVALKASTGQLVWSFQAIHHDLWDYDIAAPPVLIDYRGKPAVAVNTKIGNLFILDRETGKPLVPVEERPVPKSDVPGETASPTQPMPAWPALVPQKFSIDDVYGATPETKQWCRDQLRGVRNEGMFTPPGLQGSVVFPGHVGGVNWGGATWDPSRNLLFANTNRVMAVVKLIPREELPAATKMAREFGRDIEFGRQTGTPYVAAREFLISPAGTPCNPPPWNALVAFDLAGGKPKWESPVGPMATLGGPIATAGGLVFTGAGMDTYFRAFDSATGAELWKAELPASAQSIPMTYEFGGKQYVVIAAGGHGKLGTKMGDAVVAFALR